MSKNVTTLLRELFAEHELEKFALQVEEQEGRIRLSGSVDYWEQVVTAGHLAG